MERTNGRLQHRFSTCRCVFRLFTNFVESIAGSPRPINVEIGSPADEIHHMAEKLNADLIVIGTHGQSGLRLLLGSTANAVLHGVKRDVLAVKI